MRLPGNPSRGGKQGGGSSKPEGRDSWRSEDWRFCDRDVEHTCSAVVEYPLRQGVAGLNSRSTCESMCDPIVGLLGAAPPCLDWDL